MRKDVVEYCRSCHVCQLVGKPNQKIPPAHLNPIPAFEEPFTKVIIDCVGPLPKTKVGNQYLLTIMCASTRFPEAIPLRNIKSRTIVNALTKFFTSVGLPLSVQSDQGSNFTSQVFKQVCHAVVEYLGHVLAKVDAIVKFPVPQCKKELMRFLGMAGYYRKFCPNFSTIANPLTCLLKKSSKFIWNETCQQAFEQIKAILMVSPVLSSPNFEKEFVLQIDASDVGCGAVLLQEDEDDVCHPVAYFSKKFSKCQRNYSTVEKECLSMLLALQHFDVYLYTSAHPVVVFTDHNPLTFVNKMRNKNQRLMRWSLELQEHNIVIKHIKGRENIIADALSRIVVD